jgi:transposase InsO family protein
MDLYSRRIVGWAMADHLRTELPLAALRMAIAAQRPGAGLIHHSDRGVQICLGGLPRTDAVRRLPALDEPQGRLLRQCPDGQLLPHPQNRARASPEICNTTGVCFGME